MVLLVEPSLARRVLAQASAHTAGFQSVVIIPQLRSGALFQETPVAAAVRSPVEVSLAGPVEEISLSFGLTGRRAVVQDVPVFQTALGRATESMGRGLVRSLRGGCEVALTVVVATGCLGLFWGLEMPFWSGDLAQQVLGRGLVAPFRGLIFIGSHDPSVHRLGSTAVWRAVALPAGGAIQGSTAHLRSSATLRVRGWFAASPQ